MTLTGGLVTNDFPVFNARPDVQPAYLALVFETRGFQTAAAGLAVGTTERRRLHQRDFLSIKIDIPPRDEQDRIIDLVGCFSGADLSRTAAAAARSTATSILASLAASAQAWTTVGEVVAMAKAGGTPSRADQSLWGGGVPWLKSGEVDRDGISSTDESISDAGLASSSAWIMPTATIVIAMYGQGQTAGTVGITAARMACNQAVLGLVPDSARADGRFLFHWLRSRKASLRQRRTGSTQPNLNKRIVLDEPFPDLPLQRQRDAASLLDALADYARRADAHAEALSEARSAVVLDLLAGRRALPSSYDRFLKARA